jgi:hypothetical protein
LYQSVVRGVVSVPLICLCARVHSSSADVHRPSADMHSFSARVHCHSARRLGLPAGATSPRAPMTCSCTRRHSLRALELPRCAAGLRRYALRTCPCALMLRSNALPLRSSAPCACESAQGLRSHAFVDAHLARAPGNESFLICTVNETHGTSLLGSHQRRTCTSLHKGRNAPGQGIPLGWGMQLATERR